MPGFSNTEHYESLYYIGKTLQRLYNEKNYEIMKSLNAMEVNRVLALREEYYGNNHTQRENFEKFIEDIFLEFKY
ncbi:hypothetical protein SDC9_123187 [bioreactor metagenome]|uniref:Uncharacterized protein n=1 Tax=bioreactor metagenome TaxID=1076179 RepID=A0A645CGW3_9ZZZZ